MPWLINAAAVLSLQSGFEFFCARRVAPVLHTKQTPRNAMCVCVCVCFRPHVFVYLCLGKTV